MKIGDMVKFNKSVELLHDSVAIGVVIKGPHMHEVEDREVVEVYWIDLNSKFLEYTNELIIISEAK